MAGPHHIPDRANPGEGGLEQFERDFLAAVRRARETAGCRQRQRGLLARLVAGTVLAGLLAGLLPLLLWRTPPEPVAETKLVPVNTVQVCERSTGRAVPGAEVVLQLSADAVAAGAAGYGQAYAEAPAGEAVWTVAVTNAFGAFPLSRPETSAGYEYVVLLGGEEVARVSADRLLGGASPGTIWLDQRDIADSLSYSGSAGPAGAMPVGGGILLQAAEGTAGWDGVIYRDLVWPTVFNYGKVLDGIFRVASTGDPNRPVRVSVEVSRGKLMYFQAGRDDLRLIIYNEQYASQDDAPRRFAHRGWYLADSLPHSPAGLERIDYAVEPVDGGCSVSWLARPGCRYALLAVPRADELNFLACNVFHQSPAGGGSWSRQVVFGDSTLKQYRLFDAVLNHAVLGEVVLNPLLMHPTLHLDLDQHNQTRGLDGGWPPLLDSAGIPQFSAEGSDYAPLRIRYYDFTLSEYAQSAPLDIGLKPAAGKYRVEYDPAARRLQLTGDLKEVLTPPDWDFYLDGTRDARGYDVEIPVSPGQPASAAATFHEKQGSQVRVESRWVQPAGWLAGTCGGVPVLATRQSEPTAALAIAQTAEVSFPPYPAGVFCGPTLGPLHLVKDDGLAGQPLSSAEIVLFVSPLQGDTSLIDPEDNQYIYFDPLLAAVAAEEQVPGAPEFISQPAFPGHPGYHNLDLINTSIDVFRALRAADSGGSARDYLASLADDVRTSAFSIGLQLDLGNLPPEPELLPVLRRFAQSRYYTVERVTEQRQQVRWTIDLTGVVLKPGQALIAGAVIQTSGGLFNGQWELLSGEGCPSRITVNMADGRTIVHYLDFGPCTADRER